MAFDESIRSITLDADASLALYTGVPGLPGSTNPNGGNQYKAVKVTGVHAVGLPSAVTDAAVGILQNKPQVTGAAATVAIRGVSKVYASKAITAGSAVYITATGQATDSTSSGTATRLGVAVSTVTAAGQLLAVLLQL